MRNLMNLKTWLLITSLLLMGAVFNTNLHAQFAWVNEAQDIADCCAITGVVSFEIDGEMYAAITECEVCICVENEGVENFFEEYAHAYEILDAEGLLVCSMWNESSGVLCSDVFPDYEFDFENADIMWTCNSPIVNCYEDDPTLEFPWLNEMINNGWGVKEYHLNGENLFLVEACDNIPADGPLFMVYNCEGQPLCSYGGFADPADCDFLVGATLANEWSSFDNGVLCYNYACNDLPQVITDASLDACGNCLSPNDPEFNICYESNYIEIDVCMDSSYTIDMGYPGFEYGWQMFQEPSLGNWEYQEISYTITYYPFENFIGLDTLAMGHYSPIGENYDYVNFYIFNVNECDDPSVDFAWASEAQDIADCCAITGVVSFEIDGETYAAMTDCYVCDCVGTVEISEFFEEYAQPYELMDAEGNMVCSTWDETSGMLCSDIFPGEIFDFETAESIWTCVDEPINCYENNPIEEFGWLSDMVDNGWGVREYNLDGTSLFLIEACDDIPVDGPAFLIYNCEGEFLCENGGFSDPTACDLLLGATFVNQWSDFDNGTLCFNYACNHLPQVLTDFEIDDCGNCLSPDDPEFNNCTSCYINDPILELSWLSDMVDYGWGIREYSLDDGTIVFLAEACDNVPLDGPLFIVFNCEGEELCAYGFAPSDCSFLLDATFVNQWSDFQNGALCYTYACNDIPQPITDVAIDQCGNCLSSNDPQFNNCYESNYIQIDICVNESYTIDMGYPGFEFMWQVFQTPSFGTVDYQEFADTVTYIPAPGFTGLDTLGMGHYSPIGNNYDYVNFYVFNVLDIADCEEPSSCEFADPYGDLPWLQTLIEDLGGLDVGIGVTEYTYGGETVFLVETCGLIFEGPDYTVYNCEGEQLCVSGWLWDTAECGMISEFTFVTEWYPYIDFSIGMSCANFASCDGLPIEYSNCEDDDPVYPGDVNYDNTATNLDLVYLGMSFGQEGPQRPNASLTWEAQPCPDWSTVQANFANTKHADTNGDGTVDFDDIQAIEDNYEQVWEGDKTGSEDGVPLYMEVPPTIGEGEVIEIPIYGGTPDAEAIDFYGIAFSVELDLDLIVEGSLQVSYGDSWLGTLDQDFITIDKTLTGRVDIGISKIDQMNATGNGKIAQLNFVMIDDISGKTQTEFNIEFSNVTLLDNQGNEIDVDVQNPEQPVITDVINIDNTLAQVSIYPNPTTSVVNIEMPDNQGTNIQVLNLNGQVLMPSIQFNGIQESIDLSTLPNGIYLIQLTTNEKTLIKKINLIR